MFSEITSKALREWQGQNIFLKLTKYILKVAYQIINTLCILWQILNVENVQSSGLWFLFLFLWRMHKVWANVEMHFNSWTCPVVLAASFQSTGPFLFSECVLPLRATAHENCDIIGSTGCEKKTHKGFRSNSKAGMVN